MSTTHANLQRVFQQSFTVQDIARPLLSFDDFTPAERVKAVMLPQGGHVAGVRTAGLVSGILEVGELAEGCCGDYARPIDESQIVGEALPLAALVPRLKEQPRLFVQTLGQIVGLVEREDLLQPPARMWLFGMITLLEMRFSRMIEQHCPEEVWKASLSPGRIQKATELLAERSRRNQRLKLADCLQFSDKTHIIARSESLRQLTRFSSKREIEEVGKRLEKLRNNLAHSQDIITNDWETILALAENLDAVLHGPQGLPKAET